MGSQNIPKGITLVFMVATFSVLHHVAAHNRLVPEGSPPLVPSTPSKPDHKNVDGPSSFPPFSYLPYLSADAPSGAPSPSFSPPLTPGGNGNIFGGVGGGGGFSGGVRGGGDISSGAGGNGGISGGVEKEFGASFGGAGGNGGISGSVGGNGGFYGGAGGNGGISGGIEKEFSASFGGGKEFGTSFGGARGNGDISSGAKGNGGISGGIDKEFDASFGGGKEFGASSGGAGGNSGISGGIEKEFGSSFSDGKEFGDFSGGSEGNGDISGGAGGGGGFSSGIEKEFGAFAGGGKDVGAPLASAASDLGFNFQSGFNIQSAFNFNFNFNFMEAFNADLSKLIAGCDERVKRICENTDYPEICLGTIVPVLKSSGKTGAGIDASVAWGIALNAAYGFTNFTIDTLNKFSATPGLPEEVVSALEDCKNSFDDIQYNYQNACTSLATHDVGTINNMLSAIMTECGDCEQAFKGLSVKCPVAGVANALTSMTSNCLALSNLAVQN